MPRRFEDWLEQARRDLKAAKDSLAAGNYEWAAFQAHQAAEKAAKALLRFHHYEMGGHVVTRLLKKLEEFIPCPPELLSPARELDGHYVRSRYPDSFSSGYPGEFYDQEIAGRSIEYAEKILGFVEENVS